MRTLRLALMMVSTLACVAIVGCAGPSATASSPAQTRHADPFKDFPYTLDVGLLQAPDPLPLKYATFSPDPNPRAKGLRIVSEGMPFPLAYEVISITDVSGANALDGIYQAMKPHPDIILLEARSNEALGKHLHYFQRVSVDGKPNHVSANYLFVKGSTLFHLSASNYAAIALARESWGEVKEDVNAESYVTTLLKALHPKAALPDTEALPR